MRTNKTTYKERKRKKEEKNTSAFELMLFKERKKRKGK